MSNMYDATATWNPFKGCEFACTYCVPTFQRQAKRQKQNCLECYQYTPHCHEERLPKIPSAEIVFVCGNADISFCEPAFTRRLIEAVRQHSTRRPGKTFYFQSKRPEYFQEFLAELPASAVLLTTLETNRDHRYDQVSKAPPPSERYRQFLQLDYPRKVVTIEPILDFDLRTFVEWIRRLKPEYVWLGYNSRPESVTLPEPESAKLAAFMGRLAGHGIKIKGKTLRGLEVPTEARA